MTYYQINENLRFKNSNSLLLAHLRSNLNSLFSRGEMVGVKWKTKQRKVGSLKEWLFIGNKHSLCIWASYQTGSYIEIISNTQKDTHYSLLTLKL